MKTTPGKAMREWRESLDMTQFTAARRSGVKQSTWCRWEADASEPSVSQALRIQAITKGVVRIELWRGFKPVPRTAAASASE